MDVTLFCMPWNISVMLTSEMENECKGKGRFVIRLCLFKFVFLKGSRGIWFIGSKVWEEMGRHCEEPNNWVFHRRRQRNARTSTKVTWTFVSYPLPPFPSPPKELQVTWVYLEVFSVVSVNCDQYLSICRSFCHFGKGFGVLNYQIWY